MAEKRRKPASKMTSDEIAAHVFPPKLHQQLKRAANPDDEGQGRLRPQSSKGRQQGDAEPNRRPPQTT
jgi:hypothetical protein